MPREFLNTARPIKNKQKEASKSFITTIQKHVPKKASQLKWGDWNISSEYSKVDECMSRSKPSSEDPKFIHFIYVEKFMSNIMSFNEFIELQNLLENLLKGSVETK